MRGSKETVWAVVISAALITAGLILSCGDDDGGVSCKDVCEKFEECEILPGEDVDDCISGCEDDFDPAEERAKEFMECIVDTDCDDLQDDCLCPIVCEKLDDDCDLLEELEFEDVENCVDNCIAAWSMDDVLCVLVTECDDMKSCF